MKEKYDGVVDFLKLCALVFPFLCIKQAQVILVWLKRPAVLDVTFPMPAFFTMRYSWRFLMFFRL
jgi:hypothetical protein